MQLISTLTSERLCRRKKPLSCRALDGHDHTLIFKTQNVLDGDGRPVIEQTGSGTTPPSTLSTSGYQIFSSVLGKVVVNLNSSGGQSSTNIYAGAAQIATLGGTTSTGVVIMKSADPVTGTMTNYSYSSYGTTAHVDEEDEPLGQKIEPDDPFTDDDTGPETYSEINNSPRFPEWQCEVADLRGDGFWDRPAFCQQEMLQRLSDIAFRGLMGWNDSPENPQKINDDFQANGKVSGPMPAIGPSEGIIADALTSSSKPGGPSARDDSGSCVDSDTVICTRVPRANDPLANLDASESGQTRNPSCILNILRNTDGTAAKTERAHNIWAGAPLTNTPPFGKDLNANLHDGIHIIAPTGTYNVVALPAMDGGRVLHYNFQVGPKDYDPTVYGPQSSNLDIQLNATLNGDPLVLTLKDMPWSAGAFSEREKLNNGTTLGTVTTSRNFQNDTSEGSGLHVTLMTLKTYKKYILGKYSSPARARVPYGELIDAERDPRSPFRCP